MSYLSAFAILSLDDLKREGCGGGTNKDRELEELINRVTGCIEDALGGRQLVTRTSGHSTYLVEWHTFNHCSNELRLREWPVINVHEVAEDPVRVFGPDTVLVEDTDFVASKPSGRLLRMSGGLERDWIQGWRAIRVTYSAGYATAADVPWTIRDIALQLAAAQWHQTANNRIGVSAASDATGNTTHFYSPKLTADQLGRLYRYRRFPYGQTGERDA